jgi:hypothetical protein
MIGSTNFYRPTQSKRVVVKRKWKLEKGEELDGWSDFFFFFPPKKCLFTIALDFFLLQQCENSP